MNYSDVKIGDKLLCINTVIYYSQAEFTKGNYYLIIEVGRKSTADASVLVIDDKNRLTQILTFDNANHFRLIKE